MAQTVEVDAPLSVCMSGRRTTDLVQISVQRIGAPNGWRPGLSRHRVSPHGPWPDALPASLQGLRPVQAGWLTRWLAAMRSAAFSPIMIEAAFVLPLVMLGITLASATRRLATP